MTHFRCSTSMHSDMILISHLAREGQSKGHGAGVERDSTGYVSWCKRSGAALLSLFPKPTTTTSPPFGATADFQARLLDPLPGFFFQLHFLSSDGGLGLPWPMYLRTYHSTFFFRSVSLLDPKYS